MYYESHRCNCLGKVTDIRLSDIITIEQLNELLGSSEYGEYSISGGGYIQRLMPDTGGYRSYDFIFRGKDIKLKHKIKFTDDDIKAEIRRIAING